MKSKILYFYYGTPDKAELEEARLAGALLRDCRAWHQGDCLELCDMVMGKPENVPKPYRHLLKTKPKAQKGRKNADS